MNHSREVRLGTDSMAADKFLRALRIHKPGLDYENFKDGDECVAIIHGDRPITDEVIEEIRRLADPPPPRDEAERRQRRIAELTDSLGQMKRNGLYRRYPGRVARIKHQLRSLGVPNP